MPKYSLPNTLRSPTFLIFCNNFLLLNRNEYHFLLVNDIACYFLLVGTVKIISFIHDIQCKIIAKMEQTILLLLQSVFAAFLQVYI
jgi:hypothetical protein